MKLVDLEKTIKLENEIITTNLDLFFHFNNIIYKVIIKFDAYNKNKEEKKRLLNKEENLIMLIKTQKQLLNCISSVDNLLKATTKLNDFKNDLEKVKKSLTDCVNKEKKEKEKDFLYLEIKSYTWELSQFTEKCGWMLIRNKSNSLETQFEIKEHANKTDLEDIYIELINYQEKEAIKISKELIKKFIPKLKIFN